jgi:hypothetical protein
LESKLDIEITNTLFEKNLSKLQIIGATDKINKQFLF